MQLPTEIVGLIVAHGWNDSSLTLEERLAFLRTWHLVSWYFMQHFKRLFLINTHFFSLRHQVQHRVELKAARRLGSAFVDPHTLCRAITYHVVDHPDSCSLSGGHPMVHAYLDAAPRILEDFPNTRVFGIQYHNFWRTDISITRLRLPPQIVTLQVSYSFHSRHKERMRPRYVDNDYFWPPVNAETWPSVRRLKLVGCNRQLTDALLRATPHKSRRFSHDSLEEMYAAAPYMPC